MKDRLETAQRRRVAKHQLTEAPAINPAGFVAHSRKTRLDQPDRFAARREQPMHLRIGIE